MKKMKRATVKWGKRVIIENPEQAGLENITLHGEESQFFIMPILIDGKHLDENASTVYWRITGEAEKKYREVFGEKRKELIEEYKRQMKEK